MAVGSPQHLQLPLPGPALGQQLLAGIDRKTTLPLGGGLPDVEAGPDASQPPDPGRTSGGTTLAFPEQQGTAFLGIDAIEKTLQLRQLTRTDAQIHWRWFALKVILSRVHIFRTHERA